MTVRADARSGKLSASVIIPNFNYARFLDKCIRSALNQTVRAEVIVVDDASTDDSRSVISRYGRDVRPILFEQNRGQAAALNEAIRVATGDIVLLIDSDDWMDQQRVSSVVAEFAADADVSTVRHDARVVDVNGDPVAEFQYSFRADADPAAEVLLYGRTPGSAGVLAFRSEFLRRLGPIPEVCYRRGPDGYLLMASALLGRLVTLNEALTVRRLHAAQITQQFSADRALIALSLHRRMCDSYSASDLARRSGGSGDLVALSTWWQQKALFEYAKASNRSNPWRRIWLRHLASTAASDLPRGRKTGELIRSIVLGILPRGLFKEAYWRSHMGRPRLKLVDRLSSAHILRASSGAR